MFILLNKEPRIFRFNSFLKEDLSTRLPFQKTYIFKINLNHRKLRHNQLEFDLSKKDVVFEKDFLLRIRHFLSSKVRYSVLRLMISPLMVDGAGMFILTKDDLGNFLFFNNLSVDNIPKLIIIDKTENKQRSGRVHGIRRRFRAATGVRKH